MSRIPGSGFGGGNSLRNAKKVLQVACKPSLDYMKEPMSLLWENGS
jgi:hypothetical protein